MLAKRQRVTAGEMRALTRPTKRVQQPTLTVLYFAAPAVKKVAVVVSKKVSKKAVVRNRIRRQLYAQLFTLLPTLATGYYLVRVQPAILTCERSVALAQLQQAFGELPQTR